MDASDWDARYDRDELIWTAEPNRFLVAEAGDLKPGRALDLACGEGRNAVWLATKGWTVTAVDFSGVALEKAGRLATAQDVEVDRERADLRDYVPEPARFDLVAVFYLQLPDPDRTGATACCELQRVFRFTDRVVSRAVFPLASREAPCTFRGWRE